ncbi:MAG: MBL fold metallo-hydrolase [Deltaproteobacteria bacterium]|nr:MBL fold metallo-hydrolase [Deltaproteobacteria bacterium]
MEIGFETIGNATLIVHDQRPVLVTDPWIQGSAYFGSWKLSHEVPEPQFKAACDAEYVWFSHGHPDHLNSESLPLFSKQKILLPDHVGRRIEKDLRGQGFKVMVMPSRTWLPLSPRVRVMCIPDFNQDAILLVDVNGRLVVNLNDAGDRGWGNLVRKLVKTYRVSYLLALYGHGDADMINFFDESGTRVPRPPKTPLGEQISRDAEVLGTRFFIPFSSLHRYQRTDSAWAAPRAATPDDYADGWDSKACELLPAFLRVDCAKDSFERIDPKPTADTLYPPEHFGDDWSQRLEPGDLKKLEDYFGAIERLRDGIDFVGFKVGGKSHTLWLRSRGRLRKGLTLEAPRNSLMAAVENEVFDDLLIGNFTKVTLHGRWPATQPLYPDFTPFVAKYADNGRAKTQVELDAYFAEYRRRDQLGYARAIFQNEVLRPVQEASKNVLRTAVGPRSSMYKLAKRTYWSLRSR